MAGTLPSAEELPNVSRRLQAPLYEDQAIAAGSLGSRF